MSTTSTDPLDQTAHDILRFVEQAIAFNELQERPQVVAELRFIAAAIQNRQYRYPIKDEPHDYTLPAQRQVFELSTAPPMNPDDAKAFEEAKLGNIKVLSL